MEAEAPVALAEVLARDEDEVVLAGDALLAQVVPLRGNQVSLADDLVACKEIGKALVYSLPLSQS